MTEQKSFFTSSPFMTEQKSFVAGFLFTEDLKFVAMVKKLRPDWQAGKWNAVGGKIEPGETNDQAMTREFHEEAGAYIPGYCWHRFSLIKFPDAVVHFFCARQSEVANVSFAINTMTDEEIRWMPVESLLQCRYQTMENIPAMLILALHYFDFCATGKHK